MNYTELRCQALARTLAEKSLDAFLVTKPENVTYLTGFTGDSSFYVATPSKGFLVSDTRFEEQIKEECQGLEAVIRGHDRTTHQAAADVLKKTQAKAVGVEANHLTLAEFELFRQLAPAANLVPTQQMVESQRAIKDAGEIETIRVAIRIAERAFRMFTATVRECDTEKEMVDAMEGFVRRAGGRCTSFPPIIAVGERGALPHAPPCSKRLEEGSLLLIDWGADILYKSDITRTVRTAAGNGLKSEYRFEEIYDAVLKAQLAAMRTVRAGVNAKEVDAAARAAFASVRLKDHPDLKLEEYFTHGLGHGIGLEIHEAPRVRSNSDDVLAAGMVITLEPGIYIPGWGGIRIEDDFLVTADGVERLTTLPRELDAAVLTIM